ncbi:hypothetical protein M0R45_011573 [Rubus argutus]|uniref:Secreted protein n=1 Tax=Rubus argutus TaxID=59490 RepID=A0AAW1YAB7_RUBAR
MLILLELFRAVISGGFECPTENLRTSPPDTALLVSLPNNALTRSLKPRSYYGDIVLSGLCEDTEGITSKMPRMELSDRVAQRAILVSFSSLLQIRARVCEEINSRGNVASCASIRFKICSTPTDCVNFVRDFNMKNCKIQYTWCCC